jgi:predicted nuclease of restriction endonuclease-like (RecB) superfamily
MKRTTDVTPRDSALPAGYPEFIAELKVRIRSAQLRAAVSVNRELIFLYWQIGNDILARQQADGWGTKVIDRLSRDLMHEFPDMKGFSVRNLKYMRKFAEVYREKTIVQELLAQITWYHHITLLDKVKDAKEREWYIRQTIQNGWSRNVLVHQIESGLFLRTGTAVTNFAATLPAPQSDLARETVKDPYIFDFLGLSSEVSERELHQSLLERLRDFLIELGIGFAFIGSEYHLVVGNQDYYLDLLFYHTQLHCYVVIELKIGAFIPEYAGKLNFYLSAVDDLMRNARVDQPSIGILLCKEKNRVIAEYALRDMTKPMAVSTYHLEPTLPTQLSTQLPSPEKLKEVMLSCDISGTGSFEVSVDVKKKDE